MIPFGVCVCKRKCFALSVWLKRFALGSYSNILLFSLLGSFISFSSLAKKIELPAFALCLASAVVGTVAAVAAAAVAVMAVGSQFIRVGVLFMSINITLRMCM